MKTIYFLVSALLVYSVAGQTSWTSGDRQIRVNGQPFTVKGVNYAPIPPGIGPTETTQWGDMFHSGWTHLHDRDIPLMRAAGVNSIRIYQLQLTYPESDIDL
jgi:beta-galactosidase/beta-glucuronidase